MIRFELLYVTCSSKALSSGGVWGDNGGEWGMNGGRSEGPSTYPSMACMDQEGKPAGLTLWALFGAEELKMTYFE